MSLIKISKLGEGSFGSVWKYKKTGSYSTTCDQYYAIKFFKDDVNNTYLNPPDTFDFTNSNYNGIDDCDADNSDVDDSGDNSDDNNSDSDNDDNNYNNDISRISANFFRNFLPNLSHFFKVSKNETYKKEIMTKNIRIINQKSREEIIKEKIKNFEETSTSILREYIFTKCCQGPNIVKYICHDFDRKYITYDLYDGDLAKYLVNRKLPLNIADIKNVMFQILTGVKNIHARGIVHRDLS